MATETSLKKWTRVFSISIAIITTRLPCLMQTNSCEAEFPTFISTFRKRKKISSYHVYVLQKTRYYGLFTWYRSDFRDEFRTRMKFVRKQPIERFHSRGQHLCKSMTTNEIIYIRKEFNSHRIALVHQHGRRSSFWKTNMAAVTLACVAGARK